ncbi:unnamed protein product [Arabis nemorensis]|uniref:Uncharacterized protein n=1 Tax=Arabis nemorensis TaxID=586526 RepID=A0A565CTC1_9BRAS|nr:unnamed protein product [Arabis nemorensis]
MNDWKHYADVEEKFFRQKSRITWLKHGDQNTTVFHRAAQIRKSKNAIRRLVNAMGDEILDPKLIKAEAVHYYKEFLNKPSPLMDIHTLDELTELIDFKCSDM